MKFDRSRNRERGRSARGADPELYFGGGRPEKAEHHTRALCKQVLRALSLILAGDIGDPVIQGLMVLEVSPAPNAGRLAVMLGSRTAFDLADVLARLEAVRAMVRVRVAESITRKRAPELAFVVVPLTMAAPPESEAGHE